VNALANQALWTLGRGSGVAALLMFTVSIVLGIVSRSGRGILGVGRFGVQELHRTAALTGTALIAVHVGSLLLDPYAQLRLSTLLCRLPASSGRSGRGWERWLWICWCWSWW
jgi:sulfoxide reductase heme-binding subunit YedZ